VLLSKQKGLAWLTVQQETRGGYADTAYNREMLTGTARVEKLKRLFTLELEPDDEQRFVRFGGGCAPIVASYRVTVQVGCQAARLRLDVVQGHLPLILGDEALAAFALVFDCGRRVATQGGLEVSSWQAGQIPMLMLTPGHGSGCLLSEAGVGAQQEGESVADAGETTPSAHYATPRKKASVTLPATPRP